MSKWEVITGDALDVLRTLPDASVDAVVADPPYSSGGMVRGDRMQDVHTKYFRSDSESGHKLIGFTGDNRDAFGFWFWMSIWLGEARRVVKPGGICALFTDWRQLPATTMGLQSGGWVWRGIVPWYKPSARRTQGPWANSCEYVVWGTNGPRALEGRGYPGFFQANAPRKREHITQKPLEVMRDLLCVVPEGGTVLDPFAGSGTTGVACVQTGRNFIGIEIDPGYADIARRRIAEAVPLYEEAAS